MDHIIASRSKQSMKLIAQNASLLWRQCNLLILKH